jgi:hypothetical protein
LRKPRFSIMVCVRFFFLFRLIEGDETSGDHITKDYSHFKVIYRQYCHNYSCMSRFDRIVFAHPLDCSLDYLKSDRAKDKSLVRWIPLGRCSSFLCLCPLLIRRLC